MAGTIKEETGMAAKAGLGVTMADVASVAGVTKMIVSRVLRHPAQVRTDTRDRVLRVMGELGSDRWEPARNSFARC